MTTSTLPSLIGIRSLLKGWFNKAWQVTVTGSRLLPVAGPLFLQFLVRWPTLLQGGRISPEGFLPSVLLCTYLVLPELVNTARRMINTADGQSC
ncbi:hypothetical protein Tco_1543225 [Tanacetum coccineum]